MDSIFFKTVGFGALMNVFEDIFKDSTMQGEGFRVSDIMDYFDLYKILISSVVEQGVLVQSRNGSRKGFSSGLCAIR